MLSVNLFTVSIFFLLHGIHCKCVTERVPSDGGFVFPGTQVKKCPTDDMTCVTMDQCPNAFAEDQQFPTICDWDDTSPLICCPPQVTNLDVRDKVQFPEEDCARSVKPPPITTTAKSVPGEVKIFVVGGETVETIDTYPFMAAIIQVFDFGRWFICGGTLLSRTTILTAAHCFLATSSTAKYIVRLGSRNFEADTNSTNEYPVTSVKVHPGFKYPQLYNDIALLKIAGPTSYSDSERPICLMDTAQDTQCNTGVTILGWGATQSGGEQSKFLQEAEINITANSQCDAILDRLGVLPVNFRQGITNDILCAGNTNDISRDACQGDSGGPAAVLVNGVWRQRGIVSGGIGCGIKGVPGLYTRVSQFTEWIKQNA